ncbi:peflin-like isoform X1 [Diorhabda carinulata]|uniref:peflin-like isoform X1 n=2 Tax=Diorhabda carinulata TaxID=1163345 RepID=UPI0025A24513|nr:peflin-like isoform X1 [Diorhabda carinulata]
MSDPKYSNKFYNDNCDGPTTEERLKLITSIPSFIPSRSPSGELFHKRELMDPRELLEQRELMEQQELLEQHKLMEKRRFLEEQQQYIEDQKRALSITRSMNRRDLMEVQKKSLFSGLIGDSRGKKLGNITTNISRNQAIHPAVEKWFTAMDTKNEGRISSKELQQAFEIFQGKRFSDAACKFVVRIFDLDKNGGLDIKEFETLYYHIKLWINAFNTYDKASSGFLDENELDYALRLLDIHFSSDFIHFLVTRSNPNAKKISLDQYIITCIQIQKFTDEFKRRDPNYTGNINIKYEDFLEMILRCL